MTFRNSGLIVMALSRARRVFSRSTRLAKKHQAPSTKLQRSTKHQTPNSKLQTPNGQSFDLQRWARAATGVVLVLEIWSFFGAWSLEPGAFPPLIFHRPRACCTSPSKIACCAGSSAAVSSGCHCTATSQGWVLCPRASVVPSGALATTVRPSPGLSTA